MAATENAKDFLKRLTWSTYKRRNDEVIRQYVAKQAQQLSQSGFMHASNKEPTYEDRDNRKEQRALVISEPDTLAPIILDKRVVGENDTIENMKSQEEEVESIGGLQHTQQENNGTDEHHQENHDSCIGVPDVVKDFEEPVRPPEGKQPMDPTSDTDFDTRFNSTSRNSERLQATTPIKDVTGTPDIEFSSFYFGSSEAPSKPVPGIFSPHKPIDSSLGSWQNLEKSLPTRPKDTIEGYGNAEGKEENPVQDIINLYASSSDDDAITGGSPGTPCPKLKVGTGNNRYGESIK
ncbi:hypothetical protein ABW19_dt0207388 [Dactylella cylindrospora]|nr:hypothetical protein ABW19_dt0207388 [Dactylella cylindrospora]